MIISSMKQKITQNIRKDVSKKTSNIKLIILYLLALLKFDTSMIISLFYKSNFHLKRLKN